MAREPAADGLLVRAAPLCGRPPPAGGATPPGGAARRAKIPLRSPRPSSVLPPLAIAGPGRQAAGRSRPGSSAPGRRSPSATYGFPRTLAMPSPGPGKPGRERRVGLQLYTLYISDYSWLQD